MWWQVLNDANANSFGEHQHSFCIAICESLDCGRTILFLGSIFGSRLELQFKLQPKLGAKVSFSKVQRTSAHNYVYLKLILRRIWYETDIKVFTRLENHSTIHLMCSIFVFIHWNGKFQIVIWSGDANSDW